MRPRVAILASGGGTTAEAFIRAAERGFVNASVELVISSRKNAGILQRIEALNEEFGLTIDTVVINDKTHPAAYTEHVGRGDQNSGEEAAMLARLLAGSYDLIALMGYMKRLGPHIIEAFGWMPHYSSIFQAKMLNTHPGILPDTKGFYGEQIQEYVLEKGLPYGGQTLHLVAEEYDAGPVLAEHRVPVEAGDTPESLFERVQTVEKQFLPEDIGAFMAGRQAYLAASL